MRKTETGTYPKVDICSGQPVSAEVQHFQPWTQPLERDKSTTITHMKQM